MASNSGPLVEFSLGGRVFTCSGDTDANIDLGGFTKTRRINGNGTTRPNKTPKPWMVESVNTDIDNDNGDLEFLQANANGNSEVAMTFTYADGSIYQGTGGVEGDVKLSTANQTAPIAFSGGGALTKQ